MGVWVSVEFVLGVVCCLGLIVGFWVRCVVFDFGFAVFCFGFWLV